MTRLQREDVTYIGIALGSAAFLLWIIPAYSPPYPGYGASTSLVPNVAAGMMLVVSLLALATNVWARWLGRPTSPGESEYSEESSDGFSQLGRIDLWNLLRFMIPCALFVPLMQWLGFIPVAIAFMLLIQYLCGRREPLPAVILTLFVVSLSYVAMRYGLGVPLPGS